MFLLCGLLSACGRSSPAPVRWGNRAYKKDTYIQTKQKQQAYTAKTKAKTQNSGSIYVKRGDSAYSIASQNNVPLRTFLNINNLKPPYKLEIGQKLSLPKAKYYTVQKSDTLYSIAKNNNVSLSALTNLNTINPPYTISVGDKLSLPYAKPAIQRPKSTYQKSISYTQQVPQRSSSKFARPTQGKIISSFGSKNNGLHNDGINISAPRGTPVKSAENGIVVYSSDKIKGLGNIILIKHDGDWITTYAHLDKSLVKKGQKIDKGTAIGTVGDTGSVNSPQLHFEIRKKTKPVNPTKYM